MALANIDVLHSLHRLLPNVLCNDIVWNWQGRCGCIHFVFVFVSNSLFLPSSIVVSASKDSF